ncbi:glycosyltransferase [Bacteroides sp. 214]|uniref:glycosyltransferase n=1 Tax=Bacteroides sp. 214 TaxID=2302935 RepID=UPI0013D15BB8|nr:glycosyltransferase [Bacteroides sp. 214]NDW11338.1 glycosyltransferase [Bacteroides sp. 214]
MDILVSLPIEIYLLVVTGLFFIIQIVFYFTLYNRIMRRGKAIKSNKIAFTEEYPPLSVIICAKNELSNLQAFLPSILEQDYPLYEVIVISNGAKDESYEYLFHMEEQYPHLYHSFTPDSSRYISHKKLALTLGVKASKYDWLVFTEPNCHPASKDWLRTMARNFTPETEIVLGYSGYDYGKGWLKKRTAFDNLFTSMRYLGLALAKKPYMGIGRNMAYRKELFFKEKGYSAHLNLQRGDDDLFINQIANSNNTRVETSPESVIRIKPLEYYREWREEKLSYAATSEYYKGNQRYVLGFETTSRLLLHLFAIATLTISIIAQNWIAVGIVSAIWLLRFVVQALVINKTAKVLGDKNRYYFYLLYADFYQPIQALLLRMYRTFRKNEFLRKNSTHIA